MHSVHESRAPRQSITALRIQERRHSFRMLFNAFQCEKNLSCGIFKTALGISIRAKRFSTAVQWHAASAVERRADDDRRTDRQAYYRIESVEYIRQAALNSARSFQSDHLVAKQARVGQEKGLNRAAPKATEQKGFPPS